jgi:16S rRNA (guanine527-N7)-methyltransferase
VIRGGAFEGFPLEESITARAAACGIELSPAAARALAGHARSVLEVNPALHLTTVVDPAAFVERHLGEAFEGAALLEPGVEGLLIDIGSGNGYPGLPVAIARPGLRPVLVEASHRKAAFLREIVTGAGLGGGSVLERQVQRAADLLDASPARVITCRAASDWERVIPRLAAALVGFGEILLWAGEAVEAVRRRAAWRRLDLVERRALPGRERSWIWRFRRERPEAA